jgi:hypothetical protein
LNALLESSDYEARDAADTDAVEGSLKPFYKSPPDWRQEPLLRDPAATWNWDALILCGRGRGTKWSVLEILGEPSRFEFPGGVEIWHWDVSPFGTGSVSFTPDGLIQKIIPPDLPGPPHSGKNPITLLLERVEKYRRQPGSPEDPQNWANLEIDLPGVLFPGPFSIALCAESHLGKPQAASYCVSLKHQIRVFILEYFTRCGVGYVTFAVDHPSVQVIRPPFSESE